MVTTNVDTNYGNAGRPETSSASVMRKYAPAVDVFERPNDIVVVADVPGATTDGINIQFERGTLTLDATVRPRQGENTKYLLREYGVGHFQRSFEFSEQIDADNISAGVRDGVLTITLPKAAEARPRRIEVKTV